MTVRELMDNLQTLDPDMICFCEDGLGSGGRYPITSVDVLDRDDAGVQWLPENGTPGKHVVVLSS